MALGEEEYELWRRFLRDGDEEARDYLFLKYMPWARRIAGSVYARLRVPQLEWADFAQNAALGMMEAMSRFDPDRGLDFIAYAKLRVRGAVFNGVRIYLTGTDRATDPGRFEQRLESIAEPGQKGRQDDVLLSFSDAVVSLGLGYLLESSGQPEDLCAADDGLALRRVIQEAMEELADRDRLVLGAHYLGHVPFQDIASRLGLTKGRVSQIHKAALARLRQILLARNVSPADYL
ncbi:MAG: sigma-70 family RNA polymerase sigma factor [Rhizobium sp.]|nr:sigma-70 family RNA polymerase sigma factor [Rhizobium sp.]